jgi:hypothetical protein
MLLRRVDQRIGLTRAVAAVFSDARDPARIRHRLRDLLAQRLYRRCCGHEDLNDHDTLRADLLMQTAVGRAERLYCARGAAENRIRQVQLDLFGTRASGQKFAANRLRVLLAALAYTLIERLRAIALAAPELARASAATLRTRLLKIGAAVVRNPRRVRILLASHPPLRAVFLHAAQALAP